MNEFEEAIHCYNRALKINPKDEVACCLKGEAFIELGKTEEARKCFDKVQKSDNEKWKKRASEAMKGES